MASGRVPNTVKIFINLLCIFRVNSYQTGVFLELIFHQNPWHVGQCQPRESTLCRTFFILTDLTTHKTIYFFAAVVINLVSSHAPPSTPAEVLKPNRQNHQILLDPNGL